MGCAVDTSRMCAAALLSGFPASATARDIEGRRFDVTPFAGYRGDGDFDALIGPNNPVNKADGSFGVARVAFAF